MDIPVANSSPYKVTIVAPNCFYYQVGLFRHLSQDSRIDLTVYFCSREGLDSKDAAKMFGSDAAWGVGSELLEGYHYKFLKNYSLTPSYLKSIVGLVNLGIWREIKNNRPDAVILMSWMNPTWWLAVLACVLFKCPFFMLTDANVHTEQFQSKLKKGLRHLVLGRLLFRQCAGFLCAGLQNRELYRVYGVPEDKLVNFAYSWGYDSLSNGSDGGDKDRNELRHQYGIPGDQYVVLYCGRLSNEKRPQDVVSAFGELDVESKLLLIVGDGELRDPLERLVADRRIKNVRFLGFKNRNEVPDFYIISDVIVLGSSRETWGIVINEAMCFSLPVIVSDAVGAGPDMVKEGKNGYVYPCGDVKELSSKLRCIAIATESEKAKMRNHSLKIITEWNKRDLSRILLESIRLAKERLGK